jgi:DNA-binding HxlR family transcriptional regulator
MHYNLILIYKPFSEKLYIDYKLPTVKIMLQILSKKNNREILELLAKYGELHYGALKRHSTLSSRSLSNALNELVDNNLIKRRDEPFDKSTKRIPKTFYSLTPLGKEALKIYELAEELERKKETVANSVIINGNVSGENIIIGNSNSTIHIKKH